MTPIEVTASTIQDLMDKNIITLVNSKTQEPVAITDQIAVDLINSLATPLYDAIKGINVHRALDVEDATLPSPYTLTAPCPSLDTPWTEEAMTEFSKVLDKYEVE